MTDVHSVVLFDLGETLFDPLPAAIGQRNLLRYARAAGIDANDQVILDRFSAAKRDTAERFASRAFFRHHEFIQTAFSTCCDTFNAGPATLEAKAYATAQRDAVVETLAPRDSCFAVLEELRKRGRRLGIVSNIDDDWLEPIVERWELNTFVDIVLSSETASSCKPDKAIFLRACELINCAPSDAIFVGDDETNDIHGGNVVGMSTVLYRDVDRVAFKTTADFEIHSLYELLSLESLR